MQNQAAWNDYVGRTAAKYPTIALVHRVARWMSHSVAIVLCIGLTIAMPSNLWIVPFGLILSAVVVHAWMSVFLAERLLSMCVGTALFDLAATKVDRIRIRAIAVTFLISCTCMLIFAAARLVS